MARPGQACRRGSLAKGSRVVVVGRLQQRNWTAADGSARSVLEVVAEELGRACGGRRRPRPGRRGTPARACVTARAGTSTPFQAHRRRSRPVPAWCCSRPQSEAYSRPTLGTNAGPVMRQVRRGGS
ncbi:MAG: single-stranded DNA-binding protein [Actinomycetes bacterium]